MIMSRRRKSKACVGREVNNSRRFRDMRKLKAIEERRTMRRGDAQRQPPLTYPCDLVNGGKANNPEVVNLDRELNGLLFNNCKVVLNPLSSFLPISSKGRRFCRGPRENSQQHQRLGHGHPPERLSRSEDNTISNNNGNRPQGANMQPHSMPSATEGTGRMLVPAPVRGFPVRLHDVLFWKNGVSSGVPGPIRSQANLPTGMNPNPTPERAPAYGYPSMMPQQPRGGGIHSGGYNPVFMPDYPPKQPPVAPQPAGSKLPTHPDVQFKLLPFFDVLGELLKPSSLAPSGLSAKGFSDNTFSFHLTPQQADEIASNHDGRPGTKLEFPVQIQMRLCLLETSCPQEDHFPPNISVRVNNKTCQLPNPIMSTKAGVEPRRPPKPVNITPLCRISPVQPNTVHITWGAELGRAYCITINLVRRLSSSDLLHRLRTRGAKNADFTRALIKEKLNEGLEDEIATTSLKCSLQCPLGKCRMQLPCRAITCKHLQCFDASLYIQMNERKPTWVCPVCDKPALYRSLVIDGYFTEVLKKTDGSCMEVTLHQDGSWRELSKDVQEKPKEDTSVKVQTLDDDSGSDEIKVTEERTSPEKSKEKDKEQKEPTFVDLTLSDSDDEAPPPPKKRMTSAVSKPTSSAADTSCSAPVQGSSSSLAALRSMSVEAGAPAPPFYQPRAPPVSAPLQCPPYGSSPWSQHYIQSLAPLTPWPSAAPAAAPAPSTGRDSPDIISLD